MTRIDRALIYVIYVIYIYFGYESNVAFGKKTAKIEDGRHRHFEKKIFLANNLIIKCDMSFLTNIGAWNPFLDLRLQVYAFLTSKHHMKVKT